METVDLPSSPESGPPAPGPGPSRGRPPWLIPVLSVATIALVAGAFLWLDGKVRPAPPTVPDDPAAALGLVDTGPEADMPAPDFTVPTRDGGTFTLSEHLATDGRPVFLNLWASWCFPCREEMPDIDAAAKRHPEVLFIGVAVEDTRADAEAFAEEIGVTYLLGFDEDAVVVDGYRPIGLPATYLIGTDGMIAGRVFGKLDGPTIDSKLAQRLGDQH